MKKILFVIALSVSFILTVSASDITVPSSLITSFERSFPKAETITWSQNEHFIIAAFTEKNKSYSAYYSHEGELVVVAQVISAQQLPKSLVRDFNEKFDGAPSNLYKMNADGVITYFCDVQKEGKYYLYSSTGRKWALVTIRK